MVKLIAQRRQDSFPTHVVICRGDHSDKGPWVCDGLIQTHTQWNSIVWQGADMLYLRGMVALTYFGQHNRLVHTFVWQGSFRHPPYYYTLLRYAASISSRGMSVVPLCWQHGTDNPRLFSLGSANHNKKKPTYALKTPRVVALPFIYGVKYIIISNQTKREK